MHVKTHIYLLLLGGSLSQEHRRCRPKHCVYREDELLISQVQSELLED